MAKPADRVQIAKQESAGNGGDAADANDFVWDPLDSSEDAPDVAGIYFQPTVAAPDELVTIYRDTDDKLWFEDTDHAGLARVSLDDLAAAGGGGITAAQHKTLLQLIHFIDDGPAEGFATGATKTVTGGLFPTLVEWKRGDATLLVDKTITRSGGGATNVKPTPIQWRIYGTDGSTVLATVSDAITYSGISEASRIRTIT